MIYRNYNDNINITLLKIITYAINLFFYIGKKSRDNIKTRLFNFITYYFAIKLNCELKKCDSTNLVHSNVAYQSMIQF